LRSVNIVERGAEKVMAAAEKIRDGLLGPSVTKRLAEAEERRAALERELSSAVLDEELEKPGATARREKIERDLEEANAAVSRLRIAQREAFTRDRQGEAAALEKRLKLQLTKFEKIAADREKVMDEVSAALAAASAGYRRYRELTSSLSTNLPERVAMPRGVEVALSRATVVIAAEMLRVAGDRAYALPGAAAPTLQTIEKPAAIEPAVQVVKNWNEYIVNDVRRQIEGIIDRAKQPAQEAA
jgi:hypothetical protein